MQIRNFLSRLRAETSGNAMLLVAMGAPVLFGTTGLAIDTAQWYMWKRELQYAADQAALAGAWARGNGELGDEYYNRARQEFSANVRIVTNYTTLDDASLEDYEGGDDNSVVVTASTTGLLPFANYMMGGSTTVRVRAQATYETTDEFTACLLALDKHANKALWFHGNFTIDAPCNSGAISDADDSVTITGGSGDPNIGNVISGGGISDGNNHIDAEHEFENVQDIYDPFDHLTPPNNPTPRTMTCGSQAAQWTADRNENVVTTYTYYRGKTRAEAAAYPDYAKAKPTSTVDYPVLGQIYTTEPVNGSPQVVAEKPTQIDGSGQNKVFEDKVVTTTTTYSNVVYTPPNDGSLNPGTYAGFTLTCDTKLNGGIYVIDGGMLKVNSQDSLIGSGVMFVLKNGAGLEINGGATINLTPMNVNQLIAAGVSSDDAEQLKNMLIFEDPESPGHEGGSINGNARTMLDGIIYLPKSDLKLLGNMGGENTECLMIASKTLEIGGTADIESMCEADSDGRVVVASGSTRVRLVA